MIGAVYPEATFMVCESSLSYAQKAAKITPPEMFTSLLDVLRSDHLDHQEGTPFHGQTPKIVDVTGSISAREITLKYL